MPYPLTPLNLELSPEISEPIRTGVHLLYSFYRSAILSEAEANLIPEAGRMNIGVRSPHLSLFRDLTFLQQLRELALNHGRLTTSQWMSVYGNAGVHNGVAQLLLRLSESWNVQRIPAASIVETARNPQTPLIPRRPFQDRFGFIVTHILLSALFAGAAAISLAIEREREQEEANRIRR